MKGFLKRYFVFFFFLFRIGSYGVREREGVCRRREQLQQKN